MWRNKFIKDSSRASFNYGIQTFCLRMRPKFAKSLCSSIRDVVLSYATMFYNAQFAYKPEGKFIGYDFLYSTYSDDKTVFITMRGPPRF